MDPQQTPIDVGTVLLYLAIAVGCWLVFWLVRGWLRARIHRPVPPSVTDDLAHATFPISRPGYSMRDVDELLDRAQAWLLPQLSDADRAAALDQVSNARFTTARSGYDPRAVDTHLDALIARLSGAHPG